MSVTSSTALSPVSWLWLAAVSLSPVTEPFTSWTLPSASTIWAPSANATDFLGLRSASGLCGCLRHGLSGNVMVAECEREKKAVDSRRAGG
ncbi:hypothetical protein BKA80DRAFT_265336 [Phyllosticta citrichinensis]